MDTMYRLGSREGEHILFFGCVSRLGGEPFVNKCLFIVYEQFNKVRYTMDAKNGNSNFQK